MAYLGILIHHYIFIITYVINMLPFVKSPLGLSICNANMAASWVINFRIC